MTRSFRLERVLALGALVLLCTAGCRDEGPAEHAGRKIDEAVENARDSVQDAVEDEGPLEKAGRKLDEAAKDVKEDVKEGVGDSS